MAECEDGFIISIDLIPMFRSPGKGKDHIEDIMSVMEIMREVPLINLKFASEKYFNLKNVQADELNPDVLFTMNCVVSSAKELEDLQTAIDSQSLGKKLADYAAESGLKVTLGLQANEDLLFELELTKTTRMRAKKFFEKQRIEVQSESTSGNIQRPGIPGSSETKSIAIQKPVTIQSEEEQQQLTSQQKRQQISPPTSQHQAMEERVTDFYVFVPYPSKEIANVILEINYKNKTFMMQKQTGLIWKKSLSLPAYVREITYSYRVIFKPKSWFVAQFSGERNDLDDKLNNIWSGTTVMDLFHGKDQQMGYVEHMREILLRVEDQGLEQSIVQTNLITERFRSFESMCDITYIVDQVSKVKTDAEGMVVLSFMIGNLVNEFRMKGNLRLKHDLCMQMLSSFHNMTPEQVPTESMNLFKTAVTVIGQTVFPDTECLVFRFIEFCFGFLPVRYFSEKFIEYIRTTEKLKISKDENIKPVLKTLLKDGARQKKNTCEFLLQILRHSHLSQWIDLKNECSEFVSSKEVEVLFEGKVHHECKQIRSRNDFSKFSEFFDMLKEHLSEITVLHVRKTLLDLIRTSTKQTRINALQVQMFLKSRKLFGSPKDVFDVLEGLAASKNETLHVQCMWFLTNESVQETNDTKALIKTWLEAGISNLTSGTSEKVDCLEDVYILLEQVFSLTWVRESEEFVTDLEELALQYLKGISLSDLVFKVGSSKKLEDSPVAPVLERHLEKLLYRGSKGDHVNEILRLLTKNSIIEEKLMINTRFQVSMVSAGLKFSGLDDTEDTEKALLLMLPNSSFWKYIFNANGPKSNVILQNSVTLKAQKLVDEIWVGLQEKKLSVFFLKKIKGNYDKFSEGLCELISPTGKDHERIKTTIRQCTDVVAKGEDDSLLLDKMLTCLEGWKLVKIEDLTLARGCLQEHIENIRKGTVQADAVLSRKHWEPFDVVLKESRNISTIIHSDVFWVTCEESFQEWLPTADDVVAVDAVDEPVEDISYLYGDPMRSKNPNITLNAMLKICRDGDEMYHKIWNPLFDESDVKLSSLRLIVDHSGSIKEELQRAEDICQCKIPEWKASALQMNKEYEKDSERIRIIQDFDRLDCIKTKADERFEETVQAFQDLEVNHDDVTLKKLHDIKSMIEEVDEVVTDDILSIITEVGKSQSLLTFLKESPMDDLKNLIDAVEEYSEQSVQESTVSALLDLKRFLSPLLFSEHETTALQHIARLKKSLEASPVEKLPEKISDCNTNFHALQALLSNVANRGEMTRDIVKNTLKQGSRFSFSVEEKDISLKLIYKSSGIQTVHTRADLCDLRSRVLLMVNTDWKSKSPVKAKDKSYEDFNTFVETVDKALEIALSLNNLHESGHPDSRSLVRGGVDIKELSNYAEEVESVCQTWWNYLTESRRRYYWLNFFYPEQLRSIQVYLCGGTNEKNVKQLLRFTGCQVRDLKEAVQVYKTLPDQDGDTYGLMKVGLTLQHTLETKNSQQVVFTKKKDLRNIKILDTVQVGQIFVVRLDENARMVVPTLLALYHNTTGYFPLPYEILFCHEDTQWEDVKLFLDRCQGSVTMKTENLFMIVSVEKLSNEVQFQLVDNLNLIEEVPVRLGVICKGSRHHSFLSHFKQNVHHVQPLTESLMEDYFKELFHDVVTVTSDLPGQGKSERIQEIAHEKDLDIKAVHISGKVTADGVIEKLSSLRLTQMHLLHIDVGMLEEPDEVELLLFQIICLKNVSHLANMFNLVTDHMCIEIANTVDNILRNSLQTAMFFKRENIQWQHFSNFKVSHDISSPVQVVCNYLDVFEKTRIDTEDLYFTGTGSCRPLSQTQCQRLLRTHFSYDSNMSFAVVEVFLNVLADQLKKFSSSHFFRTSNISGMLGEVQIRDVKSQVFKALLEMSKEFATRSVSVCREKQTSDLKVMGQEQVKQQFEAMTKTSASAESMIQRVESMIRWSESNHLIVAFHNKDVNTISALYRDKSLVPPEFRRLFETQIGKRMPDYSDLDQGALQKILLHVASFKREHISEQVLVDISDTYALTPDNLLKMVLIVLRIRAHIPVIIMGETGCGKTSLILYLSKICGVKFKVQNIHAGVEEDEIQSFILDCNKLAMENLNEFVWVFLDEINTCSHLGMINDIICHHTCKGKRLAPNLVTMAACNPYKLRNTKSIYTAGLKTKITTDEQSRLVYRVKPLPESMIDYIWDYGSLSKSDEEAYIQRMVHKTVKPKLVGCFIKLLMSSQDFIRSKEGTESCVSLRDVNRCRMLVGWFRDSLEIKHSCDKKKNAQSNRIEINAIILALAHAYHSRLHSTEDRNEYRRELAATFRAHGESGLNADEINKVIQTEQKDILQRMALPDGTAKNVALQENVFVMMVCILNRIPVFVVGKPGCSKSLSLQLLKSNLRGQDSKDPYFQKLPQLYCVSFQGSESSTSDGIIKVFEKAERYRVSTKQTDVLPVVILDEVGLAEMSKFNPLKVLHSRLEPMSGERPNVAVIGISNWALDEAKMNRAIHLSRPDMDCNELCQTAKSISDTKSTEKTLLSSKGVKSFKIDENLLNAVVKAYTQYVEKQNFPNFHGLRDFYSLVKYISSKLKPLAPGGYHYDEERTGIINQGILRNFGGLSPDMKSVLSKFGRHELFGTKKQKDVKIPSVLDLVEENVLDKSSRHLLIVSEGQSALSLVEDLLRKMDRQSVTILGSQFEEDLKDDYSYRILSKIILCMEQGVVLILKDLDSIYGSLYDMLNQNYSQVGLKKTCRVAHGAYNNPVCHVHEDFRCIVFVEARKLDKSDPPFLNRFEKQCIKLMDILDPFEVSVMKEIGEWLSRITTHRGLRFEQSDLIPMNSSELLPSLIHFVSKQYPDINEKKELRDKCMVILLRACTPEGILRIEKSEFFKENQNEMKKWQDYYYQLPIHRGLACYLESIESTADEGFECKEIIFTHSNIHTNIDKCLDLAQDEYQAEKLSSYKSEKQLSLGLQDFWSSTSKKWLFIQCILSVDEENFHLMKSLVEKGVCDHHKDDAVPKKKVILIIHIERNVRNESLVNFLSGWKITVVDALEPRLYSLVDILGRSKHEVALERKESSISQFLFWAFTLMNYHKNGRDFANLKSLVETILAEEELLQCMKEKVLQALKKSQNDQNQQNWQMEVACSRLKLCSSLTLVDALEHEIYEWMKHPFAEIVFKIESLNGWESVCDEKASDQKKEVWKVLVSQDSVLEMSDCSTVKASESYQVTDPILKLICPFSKVFIQRIESLHELFNEVMRMEYASTDGINQDQTRELCSKMQEPIYEVASELFEQTYGNEHFNDYFKDFIHIKYSDASTTMDEYTKIRVIKWSISKRLSQKCAHMEAQVVELHVINWLHGHAINAELHLVDACLETANVDLSDILPESNTSIPPLENTHTEQGGMGNRFDPKGETFEEHMQKGMSELTFEQSDFRESSILDTDVYQFGEERPEGEERCRGNLEENIGMQGKDYQSTEETNRSHAESPGHSWSKSTAQLEEIGANLVSFACQKLIPTEELMKQFSLRKWMKRVRLVLSVASQVSLDPDIYQSLSLCNEFASLLVIPCQLPESNLHNVGKLLVDTSVDSEQVYHMIVSILDGVHTGNSAHRKSLQHFFSCYLYRCLAVDPETSLLELGLKALSNMTLFDSSLNFFGPTIWLILKMETDGNDIFDDDLIENSISLAYLEQCLTVFYEKGEPDSEIACVILDTLHSFLLHEHFSKGDKVEILQKCDLIFKSNGFSLRHVIALGVLKIHLSSVAEELKTKDVEEYMLQEVAGILRIDQGESDSLKNNRTRSLQEFFVRVFCQDEGMKAFGELIETLPCFEHFKFKKEDRLQALELSPMQMTFPDAYKRVMESYQALPNDVERAQSVFDAARNNGIIVYCVFGVALNNLYLMKTCNLTDTERLIRGKAFFEQSINHLTPIQEQFLKTLCTFDTLNFPLLQMSENKPVTDEQMALCVLHLTSSVLAFSNSEQHRIQGQTPWERLILNPEIIKDMYLPGGGFRRMDLHLSKFLSMNLNLRKCISVKCSCSMRYVSNIAGSNCPKCHNVPVDPEEVNYSTLRDRSRDPGYIYINPETLKNEMITVGKMSPTAFRVLQFLIHGCLAAALAIGTASSSKLTDLLRIPKEADVTEYLASHLKCHWDILSSLTEMGGAQLSNMMNFLLRNGSEFISNYRVASYDRKEQQEFEQRFDSYIQTIFANRFQILRDQVQMFYELTPTSRAVEVEKCIADVTDSTCRDKKLPKLMREHLPPSIENMEREFSLQKQALIHPLMALVFERKEELMLMKHLLPLMQWHITCVQYGSHNAMTVESKNIGDFIATFQKEFDENTKNQLMESFENFKESWNKLRESSEVLKVYNSKISDPPKVHLKSPVYDCIVRNNDSPLMQVVTALANIQNRFLLDMIIICLSSENSSSSFFIQSENSIGLPCSSLDTVTPQNIVHLPDMDEMLKFSQLSTKLGHGRERQYDMYQIECQTASGCLVNKTFLTIAPNFPMVRLPGDALDTFEILIEDITKMVGHEQLEPAVEQLVTQLRDELFSNTQGLLDYISMTFRLLKRLPSQACNRKQTLYDFMTTWQAFVPTKMKRIETLCNWVQLSQLISLYEFVEDMLTDIVKDGLEDKYHEQLKFACENEIEILTRKWPTKVTEALLSALKKLVVRYIRYDMVEVDTPLSSLLKGRSQLSEKEMTDVKEKSESGSLPAEVSVKHVCVTMDILSKSLKERERREETTASLSLGAKPNTSKANKDRKKEIAKNLKR